MRTITGMAALLLPFDESGAIDWRAFDAHVAAWLEARDTPLAAEWLGLFKAEPFSAMGLLAASAVSLAAATPALWLARALM